MPEVHAGWEHRWAQTVMAGFSKGPCLRVGTILLGAAGMLVGGGAASDRPTAFQETSKDLELAKARVAVTRSLSPARRDVLTQVLLEEVRRRARVDWEVDSPGRAGGEARVILALVSDRELGGIVIPTSPDNAPERRPEGFRLRSSSAEAEPTVWIIGADARGLLYGIGKFLAWLDCSGARVRFPASRDWSTAPIYALRGHQLGYRNTANSWDAWTVEQFDQHIRELALLGANSIENIPFQGGPSGPHMKVPRDVMNRELSRICDRYDLDYWVWTPADIDLADPLKRAAEAERHQKLYADCPRLDGVFFPGGDPGDNHPRDVVPFLEELAGRLQARHPRAGVWISLQGFSEERVAWFYDHLSTHRPAWLRGVVTGPGSPGLAETRHRLPALYRHRHYPDLTHNVRCQFPVPSWDQAYALTLGREACNPRPAEFARIHNRFAPLTDGFLSYSDGVHDDVNKAVWTQRAWDPDRDVLSILEEYCRLFFGAEVAEPAAQGILGLERNWQGPLVENGAVEAVLDHWSRLETANPQLAQNWRWQLLLLRAEYDAYTRRRKIYEQRLEREASAWLARAPSVGAIRAMQGALAHVQLADQAPVAPELRGGIEQRCAALFRIVGLQTSVARHQASGAERGCVLDFVDFPLNNRWWLEDQFAAVARLPDEEARLARLEVIRTWSCPARGSYYDNVSDIAESPRVRTRSEDATDVAWWDDGRSRRRLSTQLFQTAPRLVYEDLDPGGRYLLRVAGYGDALARADGVRLEPSLYLRGFEEFKEFVVPARLVGDGHLEVSFDEPEESHLNWRQRSKVSDVWLLKR